jgi:hypothetical protein
LLQPSLALAMCDAGEPHAPTRGGWLCVREVCWDEQRLLVKKLIAAADGFANRAFAEIERPDRSKGSHDLPFRFSGCIADSVDAGNPLLFVFAQRSLRTAMLKTPRACAQGVA